MDDDDVAILGAQKAAPKGLMADARRPPSRVLPFEPDPKKARLGDPPAIMTSSIPSDPPAATPIIGRVASTFSKYGYSTATVRPASLRS